MAPDRYGRFRGSMKLPRSAALICCLLICVAWTGVPATQPIEGLVNMRFHLDPRIFAVMAAVHVAESQPDTTSGTPDPVLVLVHDRLAGIDPDLRGRLRGFCRGLDTERDLAQRQSKYVSYALLLNGPPAFSLAYKPEQIPSAIRGMQGFEVLVEELWRVGDLDRLWQDVRPVYVREIEVYRPLIREMIVSTLQYLRMEARVSLDRLVIFIPDLLNAPGVVNARNIGTNYIVIAGPAKSGERPIRSVRHEYLHFVLDPLLDKYVGYLPQEEPFLTRVHEQPGALERYRRSFSLMVTESLLQMMELRLDRTPEERETEAMIDAYDQGLILSPYFVQALHNFEKGREPMPEVFQAWIEGIQWKTEDKRGESVVRLRTEMEAKRAQLKSKETAEKESNAGMSSLLSRANQHLMAREFGRAGELLQKALALDPTNASALFGAAQVAAQEQSLDRALELYEQAAANAGKETWIAAWSCVHRGNIYRSQEELEKARMEWSRALKIEGDLRGAADAARRALSQAAP